MQPSVSAVLFDYGMVLSGPPDPAAKERLRRVFNVSADQFHTAYWKFRDGYDRGALTADAYWHSVAQELGQSISQAQLAELVDADIAQWTAPNQPLIDWAARLQQANVKTGILSNIGDAMETGVRARCPWLENFAHHTFSHRLSMAKPDPAIFLHAAAGLGVPPEEILFLDDLEENLAAARAVGMQTIQYTTHEAFLAAMGAPHLAHFLLL